MANGRTSHSKDALHRVASRSRRYRGAPRQQHDEYHGAAAAPQGLVGALRWRTMVSTGGGLESSHTKRAQRAEGHAPRAYQQSPGRAARGRRTAGDGKHLWRVSAAIAFRKLPMRIAEFHMSHCRRRLGPVVNNLQCLGGCNPPPSCTGSTQIDRSRASMSCAEAVWNPWTTRSAQRASPRCCRGLLPPSRPNRHGQRQS